MISHLQTLCSNTTTQAASVYNCESPIITNTVLQQKCDSAHQLLKNTIQDSFVTKRQQLDLKIRDYLETWNYLLVIGDTILMDNQIVIPFPTRKDIFSALHLAHQGVTSLWSRANNTIYWHEMNKGIRTT